MAPYARAVAVAALNATLSGVWVAAGELTPARRRLVRAGAVAALGTVMAAASPKPSRSEPEIVVGAHPRLVTDGAPPRDPNQPEFALDKRQLAITLGLLSRGVAVNLGRRQLRKRWLARLTGDGHPHPTRALAVRMAAFEFAVQLGIQVADARRSARR